MSAGRREDGAVLVEFALVIVLLLIILVGMMQFGIVLNAKIDETHLASSAARYAAVDQNPGGEDATLQDYIKERADTADLKDRAQVCIEHPLNPETDTSAQVGDPVEVTMSYTYDLLPLLGDRIGIATIDVQGNATMRLEAVPEDVLAGCST